MASLWVVSMAARTGVSLVGKKDGVKVEKWVGKWAYYLAAESAGMSDLHEVDVKVA